VCLYVCLSVFLSARIYMRNDTRYHYHIYVHVVCGRGSVLLRQGDEIQIKFP